MPGAPNKPPESAPPPAPAPAALESPEQHALRRLAPSRVALRLPAWRGNLSPELTGPFLEAEAHFASGDAKGADSALDRLAIRFAEPRWPSLPEPFRALRVPVPTPQPPHWDPEHALDAPEKEARRLRRYAESQLALLRASLASEGSLGTPLADLAPVLAEAESAWSRDGPGSAFWEAVDRIWRALRERLPMPATAPARPAPASAPEGGGEPGA